MAVAVFFNGFVGLGVLLIAGNAITKLVLFLIINKASEQVGSDETEDLKGLFVNNKLVGVGFTVSVLSVLGLPLFFGFAIKMEVLTMFFEVDDTGFKPEGTILEFCLKSNPLHSQIVIPKTAIMENRGKYYVYLQVTGESYTKSEIQIAWEDGNMVQVLSGLNEGDVIVGMGVVYVRAASDNNAIPVHSH